VIVRNSVVGPEAQAEAGAIVHPTIRKKCGVAIA